MAGLLAAIGLQLALHPGVTRPVVVAAVAAFAAGILIARLAPAAAGVWLFIAPLLPALLLQVAGAQGPFADLIWIAGLTGTLAASLPWSRWLMPPLWALLLGGWALVLIVSAPVVIAREAAFDPVALREGSIVTSWAMLSSLDAAAWTVYVVEMQLVGLLWLDWVYGALAGAGERLPKITHAMWLGVTLASVVAVVQGTIDFSFLSVPFWADLRRATGTMLDANAYGVAAALAGPVGYLAVRGGAGGPRLGAAVVAVNWGGVWLSGSRTGLICAVCAGCGLAAGLIAGRHRDEIREAAVALAAATAVAVIVVLLGGAVGPLQRVSEGIDGGDLTELWSRGGYGTIAVDMTREYPLTGVGVGAYRYLAPDYWRVSAGGRLPPDNAQNWWRHQVAELGLSGALLVVLWSLVIARLVLTGRVPADARLAGATLRGTVLGIAAASLVGMPTEHPVVLLWFLFLVAWLARLTAAGSAAPAHAVRPWLWAGAVLLAIAHAGGHLLLASGPLSLVERAKRFQRDYVEGAYAQEGAFRWTDDESRFIIAPQRQHLLLRVWSSHPDVAERPLDVGISSPCGIVVAGPLATNAPFTIAVTVPPEVEVVDATIRVSRTWRPSDHGAKDTRQLGLAVAVDDVDSLEGVQTEKVVTWPRCGETAR